MLDDEIRRQPLNWMRHARRRQALGHGGIGWNAGGMAVTMFILDSRLPAEDFEQAAEFLDEYDATALPLFKRLHAAYRTQYEWYMGLEEDPLLFPHQEALRQARKAITVLNVDTINALNPGIAVVPYDTRLTAENAADIIAGYDLVADGSDNFDTRYLLNDICYLLNKPLVSAALLRFECQLFTFRRNVSAPPACYRCLFA